MNLKDRLKQTVKPAPAGTQSLANMFPGVTQQRVKADVDASRQGKTCALSFRDIGDTPPVTKRHAIAA